MEAGERPTLSGNARTARYARHRQLRTLPGLVPIGSNAYWLPQRESTATIKAAPAAYEASEPPKTHKIIEFDCRGLEFVEFIPEVRD